MYIAIEGIKGSGKSTIIKKVMGTANYSGNVAELFAITAPMYSSHPLELMHEKNVSLKQNDSFLERMFLRRAYWNQSQIKHPKGLILGDRSIATACVTRWNKWDDPYFTLRKIEEDYAAIIKPEIIIWLDTPIANSIQNIACRPTKSLGTQDEIPSKLATDKEVYSELFSGEVYNRKIKRTQVININTNQCLDETVKEIQSILKFYTKS